MSSLLSTYIWLGVFLFFAVTFFSIALWVIIRGGKDVWEILSIVKKK